MAETHSFNIPLGYSYPRGRNEAVWELRKILGNYLHDAIRPSIRFHLGYIDGSVRLQIFRSYFGLFQSMWEVLGPVGSVHRLPNGSTISIGSQHYYQYDKVPVTKIEFTHAPLMWKGALATNTTATQ